MSSKRPRSGSYGSQMVAAAGSQNRALRTARYGTAGRYMKGKKKTRVAVLFRDRTVALGLGFGQADTFPQTQVVKLHYNYLLDMTMTGVSGSFVAQYAFRLNNIYDTVSAAGGTQPYYYDTLFGANGTAAPYRQWRVLKSKVDLQFLQDNSSATAAVMGGCSVGLDLQAIAGTTGGAQLAMQRPNTRIVPLSPLSSPSANNGMTVWVDHAKMLGVKDIKDADDQVGTYNSGPAGSEITFNVIAFPVDQTSDTSIQIWYRIHITYYVECRTLNTVTES